MSAVWLQIPFSKNLYQTGTGQWVCLAYDLHKILLWQFVVFKPWNVPPKWITYLNSHGFIRGDIKGHANEAA